MVILAPPAHALTLLREALPDLDNADLNLDPEDDDDYEEVLAYVASLAASLADTNDFDPSHWNDVLAPYLSDLPHVKDASQSEDAVERYRSMTEKAMLGDYDSESDEDDSGEELCNIRFSLAYGGKILLHQTKLHLRRGHRYALVGQNGAGECV